MYLRMSRRAFDAGYWILPSFLCFIVYWHALHTWFTNDDFLWLQLPGWIHTWSDAREFLLQPTVHGTWRPISERLYFYAFGSLFGLNALPFKLWAFFTYCATCAHVANQTPGLDFM